MPVWKVLIIALLSCICLGFMMATIAIPISQDGSEKWLWLVGLIAATLGSGALLAFFLRFAGGSMDKKGYVSRYYI